MARTLYADLDLLQNALRGAVLDPQAGEPANGKAGQVYFNTTDTTLYYHDGTTWVPLSTGGSLDDAIAAIEADLALKADKATKIVAGSGLSIEGANDTLGGDVEIVVDRGRGIDYDLNDGLTVKIGAGLQWGGTGGDEVTLDSAIVDELGRLNSADLTEQAAREAADADLYDIKADKSTQVIAGTGLANGGNDNLGADITLTVDEDWLVQQIEDNAANNLAAGNGIAITDGGGAGAADTVAVRISTDVGVDNGLGFGQDGGLYVADLTDNLAQERTERIEGDANIATALSTEQSTRASADSALDVRIAAVENDTIIGGNGIDAADDGTGNVTVTAVADPAGIVTVTSAGIHVPAAAAATVTSVTGTNQRVSVVNTDGAHVVNIDAAYDTKVSAEIDADVAAEATARTNADNALGARIDGVQDDLTTEANARITADNVQQNLLDAEVTARQGGDAALNDKINALQITGTGMVTVTESAADSGIWTVDVPAVELANTYTGTTGTDATSINADLAGRGVTDIQPGDIYVNTTSGNSALATTGGDTATNVPVWVPLATPTGYLTAVNGTVGEVTSSNPGGPTTAIGLDPAITGAISASTAKNTEQDGRLDGIDTDQATQDGRLDAVEAANESQDGRLTAIEGDNASQDTAIAGLDGSKVDKTTQVNAGLGLNGGGPLSGNVTLDVSVNATGGLVVDETGLWVNTGTAINTVDGVSVKYANGIDLGVDGDTLVVKPADSTITVDSTGIKVNPAALRFTAALTAGTGPQTFAHGLGTSAVTVALYRSDGTEIWADVQVTADNVTVTTTPAVAGYVVVTA